MVESKWADRLNVTQKSTPIMINGAPKIITGADGQQYTEEVMVGNSLILRKRKEVADALQLGGKENKDVLDGKMLEASDELKRVSTMAAVAMGQSDRFTGGNLRVKKSPKNGSVTVTLVYKTASRGKVLSDEDIAKHQGCSVAEVKAWRERMLAEARAQKQATIEVAPAAPAAPAAGPSTAKPGVNVPGNQPRK